MKDVPTHFVTRCPHCSTALRVRSRYKGRQVRCQQCSDTFRAEEADGPQTTNANEGGAVLQVRAWPKEAKIVVICPECASTLRVRNSYVGRRVACKRCTHVFVASSPPESPPDPACACPPATTATGAVPPGSQSERVASDTQLQALQSQNVRLLAENEQLKTRKQQLKARKQQLKARKQQLKAELQGLKDAHDRLSSESQELRTALDRSQAAHARLSEQLDRATADLEGIRAELGGLTPTEVRSLAEERASLNSEVERLGGEIRFLRDEQSAHDRAADQLKRKEADLNAALAEVDRFAGLLKERNEGLETARAALHRLGVDRQNALDEAERLRSTFAEREETLRAESGRLSHEGDRLRAERDALRRALDHAEQAHRDELTRLEQRLEYAREQSRDIEALRGERDRLRADGEQLRADGDRLRREVEGLRRALDHVERIHGDERPGLPTELAVFAEKYDQILYDESILRLFMEQQEPHQELVEGLAHLRSPRQAPIDAPSPQPRFASPSNETLPGSPQEAEQADPPEHEPAPPADPALTADDENQAARGDAEERERRLATWGKRHAEMAATLEGMGVHFSAGHFKKR